MTEVNSPVGGHVWTGLCWIVTALMPIVGVSIMLEGDIVAGVLMIVMGMPIFYLMGKEGAEMNKAARDFRMYLRENHHWMSSGGVMLRLVTIGIMVVAVLGAITVQQTPIWRPVALGMVLLLWLSIISSGVSACGAKFIPETQTV